MARNGNFSQLEDELRRVPGIKNARVAGEDAPTEIHIIASPQRSPKQLVRDVQSLASAGFGIPIDHRIVSVVQLEDEDLTASSRTEPPAPPAMLSGDRPVLERVALLTKAGKAWVNVVLRWADGGTTQAVSTAETTRDARAHAAVTTALRALDPALKQRRATVVVNNVVLQIIGGNEIVLVQGTYTVDGVPTQVTGSAIVYDDVSTAAVHAALHAVNRRLR
jgi:hypothetical protein